MCFEKSEVGEILTVVFPEWEKKTEKMMNEIEKDISEAKDTIIYWTKEFHNIAMALFPKLTAIRLAMLMNIPRVEIGNTTAGDIIDAHAEEVRQFKKQLTVVIDGSLEYTLAKSNVLKKAMKIALLENSPNQQHVMKTTYKEVVDQLIKNEMFRLYVAFSDLHTNLCILPVFLLANKDRLFVKPSTEAPNFI